MVSSSKKKKKENPGFSTHTRHLGPSLCCIFDLPRPAPAPLDSTLFRSSHTLRHPPCSPPTTSGLMFRGVFLNSPNSVSTSPLHLCLHTCLSSRSRPHGVGILLPQELLGASRGPCVTRSKPRAWFIAAQHNTAARGIVNKYMNASSL